MTLLPSSGESKLNKILLGEEGYEFGSKTT